MADKMRVSTVYAGTVPPDGAATLLYQVPVSRRAVVSVNVINSNSIGAGTVPFRISLVRENGDSALIEPQATFTGGSVLTRDGIALSERQALVIYCDSAGPVSTLQAAVWCVEEDA